MHSHMNVKKNDVRKLLYRNVLALQVITAYCTTAYDYFPPPVSALLGPVWPRMLH
jgi:hypothetical protein